jgi:hypothetical protein
VTPPVRRDDGASLPAPSRFLWRVGLLAFWCLVLWGTLFDLVLVFDMMTRGARAVWSDVARRPETDAAWAWANRAAGLVAPLVWWLVLAGVRSRVRERS